MSNEGADATHEPRKSYSFDVFISFRGRDCRRGLIGHLYNALNEKGIKTFMEDDENNKIPPGYDLSRFINEAIEESWISIVVLSKNYASSPWCLKELAQIIEYHETGKQMVYPIYYKAKPSEVREVFAEHANRFRSDPKEVQKWKSALTRVTEFKQLHFTDGTENDLEFVQRFMGFIAQYVFRYDVFLSFRGQDTGYAFTGNLCNALHQKKIKTFFINDDNELPKNPRQIRRAIEDARISIVVFSKTYGSSTRCLEELAYIIQCKNMKNKQVWPIFYKVDPSDVRKQKGDYAMDALGNHSFSTLEKWRKALSEVANFTGFHFENGYEYKLIKRIVKSTVQSLSSYDVFLSFSSEDTRHTFSGYLNNVLCQKGFKTFMNDEGLEDGNQISQRAIENSRHFIIVFSENYAYSSWCLDELVKILECKESKMKDHVVWPIFYKVEPSDVMDRGRDQGNSYGHAIAAHEKMFRKESDKVQKWKSALSKIPYLGGYYIKDKSESKVIYYKTEHENELIEQIVKHLSFPYSGELDPKLTPPTGAFTIGLHHPNG